MAIGVYPAPARTGSCTAEIREGRGYIHFDGTDAFITLDGAGAAADLEEAARQIRLAFIAGDSGQGAGQDSLHEVTA